MKKGKGFGGWLLPVGLSVLSVLLLVLLMQNSPPQGSYGEGHYDAAYSAQVRDAMNTLQEEGKAYSEKLKATMEENIQLLDAVREMALDLPGENSSSNDVRDSYDVIPSEIKETFANAPELIDLLESMPEVGLDWQYLRIFPGEDPSISFEMFRDGGFGGSHLLVTIDSPPLDLPPNSSMNAVQVTDNWGIYWSVNAMAGI